MMIKKRYGRCSTQFMESGDGIENSMNAMDIENTEAPQQTATGQKIIKSAHLHARCGKLLRSE